MRWLVALLLLTGSALAQSQQPPASSNAPTNPAAQPAAPDQRGTDQVPLTVKVLPGQDTKEQADKAEHDRKEKAVIDEKLAFETQRIADYTDRLTWFTLLFFFAAIGQIALFFWQLRLIKESLGPAETLALTAQRQAETAEKSFVASQRPWVGIDNISNIPLNVGHEPDVLLVVKNTGPGPALQMKAKVIGGIRLKAERTPDPPAMIAEPETGVANVMPSGLYRYRPFNRPADSGLHREPRQDRPTRRTDVLPSENTC
jgi:hypothetical protein